MTALTKDRNTATREGEQFSFGAATNKKFYAGGLAMLNASGYLTPGAAATGQIAAGRIEEYVDTTGIADGVLNVVVRSGVFKFANSASGDLITIAEIGDNCYIVDDQTVAKTDGTGARSVAGKIVGVDSDGVWVRIGL